MNNGLKIAAFTAALAAAFGAAYGVGNGVDPVSAEPARHGGHEDGGDGGEGRDRQAGHQSPAAGPDPKAPADLPGGLQVAEGGYRLDLETRTAKADERGPLRFRVLDQQGRSVTAYKEEHGKELHLILASRDLNTYRHLHPTRADDGTWSIRTKLPRAGDYRLFADFTPKVKGAENLTLGADLAVVGDYRPKALPKPDRTARTEGYTVTLDGGLRAGESGKLSLKVSKDGRPVTDLEPYLGAYGHLVALRNADLAYLHVHPDGEIGDDSVRPGPEVSFSATAPSEGSYRLFLDFKHEGKVRTAAFTVTAGGAGAPSEGKTGSEAERPAEGGEHQH